MKKKLASTILFYLLVLFIALIVLFPFLWMLTSSFKTQVDIISWPPKLLFEPTLRNYRKVFEEQDFLKYFFNSTIVGSMAVGLSLLLGLPAAYSISRFAQKRLAVFILLARLMPGISFLMPWYIIFSRLGLMDIYVALILSHMLIALPIVVWIMSTYFGTIPRELEESAMVDGATRQMAFLKIILPLSGPGIITATTLAFIFSWNNFMFSQVLSMERTKTLPIAVYNFLSYAEVDWGWRDGCRGGHHGARYRSDDDFPEVCGQGPDDGRCQRLIRSRTGVLTIRRSCHPYGARSGCASGDRWLRAP